MPEISGRIFFTTDPGWLWSRDDGSEWSNWGQFYELFEPDQTGVSWVNQGSATITTTDGGAYLNTPPPGGAGENVRLRVKTPDFTKYFVDAGFLPSLEPFDQTSAGIIFRETATSRFIFLRLMYDTTSSVSKSDLVISLDKYTDPTTFSSSYAVVSANVLKGSMVWLRMRDNGTNLRWNFSSDNYNYTVIDEQPRNDFFTTGPDQIGFAVNSNNTSGSAGMTLLSFKEYERT